MVYEAELRSFISREKYDELVSFFSQNAELLSDTSQETHYLNSDKDLRIQKNDDYSKVWLKLGKMHDEQRKEIEIRMKPQDFDSLKELFETIGFGAKIKWFRKRKEFSWKDLSVCLDDTKGYGTIIEIEKLCNSKEEADAANEEIKQRFSELGIMVSPKEEFMQKFQYYEKNWKDLINQ
jgi:predicted adenylyl cyclase CyaB